VEVDMAFFTGTPQADTFEADVRDVTITAEVLIDASGNPVVQQDGITVEEDGRTVALTAELTVAVVAAVVSIAFPPALVVTIPIFLADAVITALTFFGPPVDPGTIEVVDTPATLLDVSTVDYSLSPNGVVVDLDKTTQHGGYAEGDRLVNISHVFGSFANDVIRGTSRHGDFDNADLANNVLVGGINSDVLEGRGGADLLIGGSVTLVLDSAGVGHIVMTSDFATDFASYESSPAAVTVRLGDAAQTAIATGGDAEGDTLLGIEGLIGSRFDDVLTGNSLDNVLAGGLGNDVLDGKGGTADRVDYSRTHLFDFFDSADRVVVRLGLNGANGTGTEFKFNFLDGSFAQVSVDTLKSIENVTGTAGDDDIVGNEVANFLEGLDGDDILDGGLGNDTLVGDDGSDTASFASHNGLGRTGNITLGPNGGNGSAVYLNTSQQVVETDVLREMENIIGADGNETITGNEQDNVLDGGLGNDTLIGRDGNDTASFASHNGLSGRTGAITLGSSGADGSASYSVLVSGAPVTVESDVLRGIENVIGSRLNETITGNEQENVLDGGLGNDTLIGGNGIDTASFVSHDIVTAEFGTITIGASGADGSARYFILNPVGGPLLVEADVLGGMENVTGSNQAETITGNEQANVIDGRGGNDTIDGGFGNDKLIGGDGTDTVSFASHDSATGQIGTISLPSVFLIGGGIGAATYSIVVNGSSVVVESDLLISFENVSGSNQNETIMGNESGNVLDGRGGDDTLDGRQGNDTLNGGLGNDTLIGGVDDDTLNGGAGHNTVNGGTGNDTYVFTLGAVDRYFDESGTDRVQIDSLTNLVRARQVGSDLVVQMTSGSFTVVNHFRGNPVENLVTPDGRSVTLATVLTGGNGSGIISGGNGGETLDGRGGDDFLFAGNGSDRLIGGDGNDQLTGGNGGDTFVLGPGFGHDEITDFTNADRIEFDGGLFGSFQAVQAASQQVGNDTVITLDADDSITLQGVALKSLRANDFRFVAAGSPASPATDASPTVGPNLALLGSYMASTFVIPSDGHGSTPLTDAAAPGAAQPLISSPHG
jgi:Ca2+-binding RTX toxin-like protein